jgi:competence protein ComEA
MSRPRMLLGGAVLVLLLGGCCVIQSCRNAAAPPPVVVTRFPPADPPSSPPLRTDRSAVVPPVARPAAFSTGAGPAARAADHAPTEIADPVMVHVVGAVRKPGVYRLAPKARLIDAVHAAGGPKAGADLEAVNLASFVQDGEQIRVPALAERRAVRVVDAARSSASRPARSELPPRPVRSTARYPLAEGAPAAPASALTAASGDAGKKGGGLVNINTAGEEELKTLPGVGPKTAEAILAYRQEHGPFQRPEDLMEIRGIGEKKLARMRDRVVVK